MTLSVIIPAYNAEKTLLKCVGSVLRNRTVAEVIVIDDGSCDSTADIALQVAHSDGRVKLVKQENAGPFIARINGVRRAEAQFVTFVDADDFVEDCAYDDIFKRNDLSGLDVLEFGWVEISEEGDVLGGSKLKKKLYSGNCAKHFAEQKNTANFLWNKIFRREILGDIEALPLHYSEDACFLAQVYLKAEKCLVIPQKFYNYVSYESSLARRPYNEKSFDNIVGWRYIRNLYVGNCPEITKPIDLKLCSLAVILYSRCPENEKAKYLEIFREHRRNISVFTVMRYGSLKRKIMIMLFPRFKKFVEKRLK